MSLFTNLFTRISKAIYRMTGRNLRELTPQERAKYPLATTAAERDTAVQQGFIPVQSSNVAGMRWQHTHGDIGDLFVKFLSGAVYVYYNVHESVYDDFFAAGSKGQFVWRYLRDKYQYKRVQ